MNTKPISIVADHLIPVGKTSVYERYPRAVAKEIAQFKADLKAAKNVNGGKFDKNVIKFLQDNLTKLENTTKKVVTMITRYTDSKGAKYAEVLQKNGNATKRKLYKEEVQYMNDGKKIVTKTVHDKSDRLLAGQGFQDGVIKKSEEFYTKNGVKNGRRTTTQLASGYGGKTVEKELAKDGGELTKYNTARTVTDIAEDGKRLSRTTYEPGDVYGVRVPCNEKGIPQIEKDAFKHGW